MDRVSPCFITMGLSQAPHDIYGLPALEYPGLVKVSGAQRWQGISGQQPPDQLPPRCATTMAAPLTPRSGIGPPQVSPAPTSPS